MEAEKLDTILMRLDTLTSRVHELTERQRKQDEFLSAMSPILKEVMATATTRLDDLEKKGYFAFGRELVGDRVPEPAARGRDERDLVTQPELHAQRPRR
mgnify:CR=1 FL=1